MIDVINEMINEMCEVDYNEWKEGDVVRYEYNLVENRYENEVKEYVGGGIEMINENFNEIKYKLSIENNNLIIEYVWFKVG